MTKPKRLWVWLAVAGAALAVLAVIVSVLYLVVFPSPVDRHFDARTRMEWLRGAEAYLRSYQPLLWSPRAKDGIVDKEALLTFEDGGSAITS